MLQMLGTLLFTHPPVANAKPIPNDLAKTCCSCHCDSAVYRRRTAQFLMSVLHKPSFFKF